MPKKRKIIVNNQTYHWIADRKEGVHVICPEGCSHYRQVGEGITPYDVRQIIEGLKKYKHKNGIN